MTESDDETYNQPGTSNSGKKTADSPPNTLGEAAASSVLSPEEEQNLRRLFEDKKFDQVQKINVLQCAKDFALAIDAHRLPLDDLARAVEARAARLFVEEAAAITITDEVRQLARRLRISDPEGDGRLSQLLTLVGEAKMYLEALSEWIQTERAVTSRSRSASDTSCVQNIDGTIWESTPTLPPRPPVQQESIVFRYDFVDTNSLAGPTGSFLQAPAPPRAAPPPAAITSDRRMSPQLAAPEPPSPQAPPDQQLPPQAAEDRGRHSYAPLEPLSRQPTNAAVPAVQATLHSTLHPAAPPRQQIIAPRHPALELMSFRDPLLAINTPAVDTGVSGSAPSAVPPASSSTLQQQFTNPGFRDSFDRYTLGRKARQVPKFGGDTKKFREWEQLFKVFVDETPAPTIEKFNLLRTSLTGRAKDAISHLQWEESHYQIAKDILREKFGDTKLAQRSHIQELDNLVSKGLVTNGRLEAFVDSVGLNIRALVALGVTFTELSTTTNQRILRCLPLDLREKFIVKLAEFKMTSPLTTDLEFMLTFLETTVRVRREAEWGTNTESQRVDRRRFQSSRSQDSRYRNPPTSRDNHSFFAADHQRHQGARQRSTNASRGRSNTNVRGNSNGRTLATNVRNNLVASSHSPAATLPPIVSTSGRSQTTNAPQTSSNTNSQSANRTCIFCEGSHEAFRCNAVLSLAERVERIQSQEGCTRCLKRNHTIVNCRDGPRTNCPRCNARHYLIMCPSSRADDSSFHIATEPKANELQAGSSSTRPADESDILLQTAVVWVESGSSRVLARILLDTGAHRSYIATRTAHDIDSLPIAEIKTAVKTLGNAVSTMDTCVHRITLRSRHDPDQAVTIDAIETPEITNSIFPDVSDNLGFTPVADTLDGDNAPRCLSIIVGAIDLAPIHTGVEKTVGRMMVTSSIFGWLFSGTLGNSAAASKTVALLCELHPALPVAVDPNVEYGLAPPSLIHRDVCRSKDKRDDSIDADLRFLWEGEFMGFEAPGGSDEQDDVSKAMSDFFDETTVRYPEGFYELCLPFRDNLSNLGDNEGLARSRLFSLIRKLRKKEGHLRAVDDEIRKNVQQGFIERASPRSRGQRIHFLPLQAVFKYGSDGKSIAKTRVVRDASARMSHRLSLNDCLHSGNNLLPLIPSVLCAFRECRYPITADIQNAFLQFRLNPSNRPLLRFLWPLGVSDDAAAPTQEFWSTRLEFGLTCSPWCHIKGVQHHLQRSALDHPDQATFIEEISENLYMDDVVFRTNSVGEAERKISFMFDVFQSAHFPLKKWSTNNTQLADVIRRISPIEGTEITVGKRDAKFLGVKWIQPSDDIGIFAEKALDQLRSGAPSKRILLKGLAQIYDPLGLLSPVSIRAKTLFQTLWKRNIDWDDKFPQDVLARYESFVDLLSKCAKLSVGRSLAPRYANATFELHAFCDASLEAYGCAIYLRTMFDSKVKTQLVVAKARVAPLKNKGSIHRYELMGALLAARITTQTRSFLKIQIAKTRFWIDNMACVSWIHSSPERWQPFVANRVRLIQNLTDQNEWFYVRSEDNPSDIVSRGSDISSPTNWTRWVQGPEWLNDPNWETPSSQSEVSTTEEERRSPPQHAFHIVRYDDANAVDDYLNPQRFSSWCKLVRAQAWCNRLRRYAEAIRQKRQNTIVAGRRATLRSASLAARLQLDAAETAQAEHDLIGRIQRRHFASEIAHKCRNILPSSPLYQYSPFIDQRGIVRCRSRLERTESLPYDARYPIIIPSEGGWAKIIVLNVHARDCWHWGGVANTLQALRKRFLILKARRIANAVLKKCIGCRRFKAKPAQEETPALPAFRIEESPPFFNAGVDFFGPVYFKTEEKAKARGYVIIFACCVTRAVHLELTIDMSAYEVLRALQKFLHRYPSARNFKSDNGAAFHRAEVELKLIYRHIAEGYIGDWLAENRISWTYITPAAPWTGSFYERQIGSVKRCLRKVLGKSLPYFRDLEVILSGAQAIVNRRPITTVSTDPNEFTALTPANLVVGYFGDNMIPESATVPQHKSDISAVAFSKRWIFQQHILADFWERYRNEYLVYLRTANQRKPIHRRPLRVGDVCMLKSDEKSRAYWPLVRVLELHPTDDGLARSCTVRTTGGKSLVRPVKLLYRLESADPDLE